MTVFDLLFNRDGTVSWFEIILAFFLSFTAIVLCMLPRQSRADSIGLDAVTGIVAVCALASIVWVQYLYYFQ